MIASRHGRRVGAFGPLLCAVSIALVLGSDLPPEATGALAAIYGLGFAATVCPGPWIAAKALGILGFALAAAVWRGLHETFSRARTA